MGTGVKLPTDPTERKKIPIYSGVLKYFPDAIAEVAKVSWAGNEQHNKGEPLHWAREKSTDHEDTTIRHLMEAGEFDTDGQRHTAKAAWRILATLQLEIEADRKKLESQMKMQIQKAVIETKAEQSVIYHQAEEEKDAISKKWK
jgi:hypothetical protein